MDILGAMLVYLGSVTGIIAALAISGVLYFSPSHHATPLKQSVAMIVQQSKRQETRAAPSVAQSVPPLQSTVAQSVPPPQTAAAAAPLQVQAMRAQYLRRIVQEGRAKRWAYQQDPSFENRFLGYAD